MTSTVSRIGTKFLVSFLLTVGIALLPARVHADEADGFGPHLLKCFHPDAKFSSMTYAHGRGHHAWKGWIKFQDGRTDAAMSFVMDVKTRDGATEIRITPVTDDALTAPESGCYLREWQRAY
jgi:hypothetical protein